jgi:hypothetical protein
MVSGLLLANADSLQATLLGVSPIDLCLGSILRRTKGLFTQSTEVDYVKSFSFDVRSMQKELKQPIDPTILKLAGRSDIKRLQRVLNMLTSVKRTTSH